MNSVVVFSTLLLAALCGTIQDRRADLPPRSSRPVLRVDHASFDWGTVVQGDTARHGFMLHNDGSEVLRIEDVRTACGCTAVDYPATIDPGATGVVTVEIDTENLGSRSIRKTAFVSSNDPDLPILELEFGGIVLPIIECTPRDLELAGPYSEVKHAVLTVTPSAGFALDLAAIRAMSGHVSVAGIEMLDASGSHAITLEVAPADRAGEQRDVLQLFVVGLDGLKREKRIPVVILHQGRVHPDSRMVVFSRSASALAGRAGFPVTRSVTLSATGPDVTFEVTGVELEGLPEGLFRVAVSTLEEHRSYVLTIECMRPDGAPIVRGRLRISTDDREVPSLEIPIFAQFSAQTGAPKSDAAPGPGT